MLVRAAPRSGRTTLLRSLARAAAANETARVIVLLIDERPEEATAWREALPVAEFAIATADLAPVEQVRTAELALERARRLAEAGVDAILLCDSLTRLAHAAGDVAEVKRLFGSGRNLAGGGSLTVIATTCRPAIDGAEAERAVITTETALVALDPDLAAAGVTPPLNARESRISNEDQLRDPDELEAARRLRAQLADLDAVEAANLLRDRIEATSTNAELLQLALAPSGWSALVGEPGPRGLARELDRLGVAIRLHVAEAVRLAVEDDVELALLDPLVEPGAAEDQPADPVDEAAVGGPDELCPVLVDVLAEWRRRARGSRR